jgi:type IV pilus assembly protein PilY1
MKNLITGYRSIAATATLTLWCCLAQADDIEIYRGTDTGTKPVSMMVIDTSGSMSYWVQESAPDYQPNINYKVLYPLDPNLNTIDYLNPDLYYFNDDDYSGTEPSNEDLNSLRNHPFPIAALKCDLAQTSMLTQGFYSGNFKRWNPSTLVWEPSLSFRQAYTTWWGGTYNRWVTPDTPLGDANNSSAIIDCRGDETAAANQYIKANPAQSNNQYLTYKDNRYNDAWGNYFPHIYSGNYINYLVYIKEYKDILIGTQKSRMQVTKEAAKFVVETTGGIKLGLARFNTYGNGGMIDIAADDIEDIRSSFAAKIDSYLPWNGTPLSEAFYETAQYLRGGSVAYGQNSSVRLQRANSILIRELDGFINYSTNSSMTYQQDNPSVGSSRIGNTYDSPIDSACHATSNLVLFTDGEPSPNDTTANDEIRALLSDAGINFQTEPGLTAYDLSVLTNNCDTAGGCAEELAYYLANTDQRPLLPGKQTINTHVIGGFFDENSSGNTLRYMEDIARFGQGTYTSASNKEDIAKAFKTAVTTGYDKPVTFVAPAVSVNSYNSLEHLDSLFYAMFVPSTDNNWKGNLKSYRLAPDGSIVDADGDAAIDGSSGRFKEASRSYWTAPGVTDGGSVLKGGAAANLRQDHNIFTHLSTNKGTLDTTLSTDTISKAMLGLSDEAPLTEHTAVIDWLNREEGSDTRLQMEDPLHSRPVVVNYGYTEDPNSDNVISKGVVFIGTNSGYLHAINADKLNFKEYFSYIPKELLANANLYYSADPYEPKPYGVDGPINYWHVDANQNAQVDNGEKVYLYFGLRRGGRHYYALDISDPENPKFQWQITGGQGGDFDNMGQSWSPISLAKIRWGNAGKTKVVLLFGGGYDAQEDSRSVRAPHDMGNSIYMIDPETGKLLWSASDSNASMTLPDMTNAITSEIKTIDFDGDQITDYFFVSDVGGRVWRFDLNADITTTISKSNVMTGAGVIFDANKVNNSYQRFYDAPSVSYFSNKETKENFLTISLGSGFRAHPLQAADKDSFYIIKDSNIMNRPTSYETLDRNDFLPISTTTASTSNSPKGWMHDLPVSEKVLSPSLTSNGSMYFTTFSPTTATANVSGCNADIGQGRVYTIDFEPSSPVISSDTSPSPGPPPAPIELTITKIGQINFCTENPGHTGCQPPDPLPCEATNDCPPLPPECETSTSVILSGTSVIAGGADQCELLKRDFWRSL